MSLWTSPDLATWTPYGPVLQMIDAAKQIGIASGIMFCPKVLFHAPSSTWVAWINYIAEGSFSESYYASFTASSPTGPWTVANRNITLAHPDMGDFSLFADGDGG